MNGRRTSTGKMREGRGSYVRRVSHETQQYAKDLLNENERLRILITRLETERGPQRDRDRDLQAILQENEVLRGLISALERQASHLQEQLLAARDQLDHSGRQHSLLEHQISEIEATSRRFSEEYAEVERQNSNLANLYVASYRLHGTLDRKEVLETVQEIVANLVGSEEMGIFEMDASGKHLLCAASLGIDPAAYQKIPLGSGIIGKAALDGEIYVARQHGRGNRGSSLETDLTACIPLRLDERIIGAIAIFRLLPQKTELGALDHELFELLATHAATALYCSTLYGMKCRGPHEAVGTPGPSRGH